MKTASRWGFEAYGGSCAIEIVEVYVKEAFPRQSPCCPAADSCEYVGTIELPKGFGPLRMYCLKARSEGDAL